MDVVKRTNFSIFFLEFFPKINYDCCRKARASPLSLIGPGFVQVCLSALPSARHYSNGLPGHSRDICLIQPEIFCKRVITLVSLFPHQVELHLIDSWFPLIHPQTDFLARALRVLIEKGLRQCVICQPILSFTFNLMLCRGASSMKAIQIQCLLT